MNTLYHYIGMITFWSIVASTAISLLIFLWIFFWDWNENKYTWLYQLKDFIKSWWRFDLFGLRTPKFEESTLKNLKRLLTDKDSKYYRLLPFLKKYHLNFIDKELKKLKNDTKN